MIKSDEALAAHLEIDLLDTLLEPNHNGDINDDNIKYIRENIKQKGCVDLCTKEQAVELASVIFKKELSEKDIVEFQNAANLIYKEAFDEIEDDIQAFKDVFGDDFESLNLSDVVILDNIQEAKKSALVFANVNSSVGEQLARLVYEAGVSFMYSQNTKSLEEMSESFDLYSERVGLEQDTLINKSTKQVKKGR